MPPEQASGETDTIGPAADIYSLGAILYALLDGSSAVSVGDVMDTLVAVLEQEPVTPRQLNPALDQDLETICLKCLEKDAGRRYATTDELVAELGRYLNGEPIHARPIGKLERGWRWCKRKPALAGLGGLAVLLLLTLGIGGPLVALQQSALRTEAVTAQNDAEQQRRNATQKASEAEWARDVAKDQREVAEENFTLAREAVDKYMTDVSQSELFNAPNMAKLRLKLLEGALEFYTTFAEQNANDLEVQRKLAEAHAGAADALEKTGEYKQARRHLEKSVELYEALQAHPKAKKAAFKFVIGTCYLTLGHLEMTWTGDEKVSDFHLKAIDAYESFLETHPDSPFPVKAQLCVARQNLASQLRSTGALEEALKVYRETRPIIDELMTVDSDDYVARVSLAQNMIGSGYVYRVRKTPGEALECFTDGAAVLDKLLIDHPEDQQCRELAGEVYNTLWVTQRVNGDFDGAFASANHSLEIMTTLYEDFPENVGYLQKYSDANARFANSLWESGRQEEALASMTEAYATRMLLYRRLPEGNGYLDVAGETLLAIADWRKTRVAGLDGKVPGEELEKATRACRDAIDFYESRRSEEPDNVGYVLLKGRGLLLLASTYSEVETYDEAMDAADARIDLLESLPDPARDEHQDIIRDAHRSRFDIASNASRHFETLVHVFRARELNESLILQLALFAKEKAVLRSISENVTTCSDGLLLVDKYTSRDSSTGRTWFDGARLYALAGRVLAKDETLSEEDRATRRMEYNERAMTLLAGSRKREFFTDRKNLSALKTDTYLASLRESDDFKEFVKELEVGLK